MNAVNEQPVRLDAALAKAREVSRQIMVLEFIGELFAPGKALDDIIQQFELIAALSRKLQVLPEFVREELPQASERTSLIASLKEE